MAGHVFISYSRVDRAYVEQLAAHLTAAAIPVWYDSEVEAGKPFSQMIQQAIDECSAFVVVLTPAAVASEWVRRELSRGSRKEKSLFPLLREPREIPIELDGIQNERVTEGLMPSQRFVARLRSLLASTSTTTSELNSSGEEITSADPGSESNDEIVPLPWIQEDDETNNSDHAVGDWDGRQGLPRGVPRRLAMAGTGVLGAAVGLSISVSILRWPQQGWVAAACLGVALLVGLAWWWRGRKSNVTERRQQVMLKRVRNRAEAITKQAKAGRYLTPRFTILVDTPDSDPGKARKRKHSTAAPPLREAFDEGDICKLHERAGEDLVLLADAGLGKTIQMAMLARHLATDALDMLSSWDYNDKHGSRPPPIPVLLSLSTYRGEPLQEWLVTEINQAYDVAKKQVRAWLDEDLLLPLLDGLDQVPQLHRRECTRQIRRFRERCSGLVISCRSRDYHLARTINAALYAEIARPSRHDVQNYLTTNADALADVHAALAADKSLWELLRSPLMLNIIYHTYAGGQPATELRQPGTIKERQGLVFDAYFRRMLTSRPTPYTPQQTIGWLTWLARTLTTRGEDVLYLDRLQPTVLDSPIAQQRVLRAIIPPRILICLILAFGWLFSSRLPISGLLVAMILVAAIGGNVSSGMAEIKKEEIGRAIQPVDHIGWKLSPQRLFLAASAGVVAFIIAAMLVWPYTGWQLRLLAGCAASFTTVYVLILGEPYTGKKYVRPNQRIRRCGMNALIVLFATLIIPVATAPVFAALLPIIITRLGNIGAIIVTGLIGAASGLLPAAILQFGGNAFVRHWMLRWHLHREGSAPMRYVRFLHDAEGRILLRRVGNGFTFPHRMLQEHLNTMPNTLL